MSVHSDTSRSVREEAHQKLDALLYSISSRQLERVYGITRDDAATAETDSSPPPLPPARQTPPVSAPPQGSLRRSRDRTPPSVRWKDDEATATRSTDDDYDVIKDGGYSARPSFPPLEDFQTKLEDLRRKQRRHEELHAVATAAVGTAAADDASSEMETFTPYVDALLNYVHFLEKEKSDFAAEMEKMRRTIGVVAKENAHLHQEIKRGFLEAVVSSGGGEGGTDDGVAETTDVAALMETEMRKLIKRHELESERWKDKIELIERERNDLQTALKAAQKETDSLNVEIEMTRGSDAQKIVESLLNERNSLSQTVMDLSRKMSESKAREEELTTKLKKTILVADQSLFEKDEMALREEKARRELEEERTRWEEEERRKEEERKAERDKYQWESEHRIAGLEEALATAEGEVLRLAEKLTALERKREAEAEERRKQEEKMEDEEEEKERLNSVTSKERPSSKKNDVDSVALTDDTELNQRRQTEERLRQEIVNYEAKTRSLERDLTGAREEIVKLHERVAEVERDASLARLKRETMAKFRFDDAKESREEAERRIEEAKNTAVAWRDKYTEDVDELKTLAGRQSELIASLKEECLSLTSALESTSKKLESETQSRLSEADKLENSVRTKTEELRKERLKSKKMSESVRKLKKDVARLNSLVGEQRTQILEMNDAVAKAITDRQMQAKENEFLRQIHLPTPAPGQHHLRTPSGASSYVGGNRLLTPPLVVGVTAPAVSDQSVRLSPSYHASAEEES